MNDAITFIKSLTLDDMLMAVVILLLLLVGLWLNEYTREFVRKH